MKQLIKYCWCILLVGGFASCVKESTPVRSGSIAISAGSQLACEVGGRPEITVDLVLLGTLSKPRAGTAIAAAGNKIVVAGGLWTSDCPECWGSSRADIFDISTNSWTTAELSAGRWSVEAVTAGNRIFFAGGQFGDGAFDIYYDNVDIFDATAKTWTVKHLSEPRGFLAAGTLGDKVFFAGGEKNWNYDNSAVVDIYDLSSDTFSSFNLSAPRAHISAVAAGKKIYFAGGEGHNRMYQNPSDVIDIFDNSANTWSLSKLSVPMSLTTGTTMGDSIYWGAGCDIEIKDVTTGISSIARPYKTAAWFVKAVTKDKLILFLGGTRGPLTHSVKENKFDIYNTTTKTWHVGILPITIECAVSYKNNVYVADRTKLYRLKF